MSSTVNNNQLIPSVSSNNVADNSARGPASTVQVARSQQNQSTSAHGRGRFGRTRRGRGGKSGFQAFRSDAQQSAVQHSEEGLGQADENANGTSSQSQSSNLDHSNSNLQSGNRGRPQRGARGGGGGGKYRQRQQTSQLIDGLDGLDIDLVESLAPTNTTGQAATSGKGRHATNSRKVNLTHLLNYRYDRRQPGARHRNTSFGDSSVGGHYRSNYSHYRDYGHVHKFSKQQFLQANCQFVVLDGHDYTVHKVDPDWPVEWDCIEEVKFRQIASTETTCPICLEPPVAAKITRCGHIYCWTCMLHYLALSDENCRQCPICFEPVYRSDLRSVVSQFYPNHAVEEDIVMRLMIRKKGCVEVEPYWKEVVSHQYEPNPSSNAEHYCSQANLVIVDPQTVISKVAQRERNELMLKLELDRDEPEVCFIERALDGLNKRIERLQVLAASTSPSASRNGQNRVSPSEDPASSKSYLFYQSADGQHIYLNPFSTKILCQQYGSLENCPLELKAKILQMDWVSMSEAWRKRFKYLEHLPLTCEFRLIEIDFEKSEIVSREIFSLFEDQIRLRANERERRRREERKREKIIQVEQNRKIYGIQPSLKINLNNIEQFPSVSDERYLGLSKPRTQSGQDSDDDDSSDETGEVDAADEIAGDTEAPQLNPPEDVATTGVTLSFKDIQLQEAAVHAAQTNNAPSVWGQSSSGRTRGGTSQPAQSSFAKLLEDAKTSQKEWTKSATTSRNSQMSYSSASQSGYPTLGSSTAYGQMDVGHAGEEEEEELRAPPSEFTISDFIDMNVVSGSTKRGKGTRPKNYSKSKKG